MTEARSSASWALAGIVFASVVVAAAAGAGTPLLSLYQRSWGFPVWQLTAAFTVYAVTLLLTLLAAGSLSDHIGRRPVLIGALALMVIASVLFLIANQQVGGVIAARAVQGVATGAATSTFAAAIVELSSQRRRRVMTAITSAAPVGGLAIGALVTGVIIDVVHDPTAIVFWTLMGMFVVGMISVVASKETSARSPGALASLLPLLRVSWRARRWFAALAPLTAAGWMFSGLFLGLAPTFDRTVFAVDSGAVNGIVVALQPASAAVFSLAFSGLRAEPAAMIGAGLIAAGALLAVAGVATAQLTIVGLGAIVGGAGQGAGFGSALRILAPLAKDSDRGGLFSAVYLIAYASYGIPVFAAGSLAESLDLRGIVLAYGAVVAALAAWALVSLTVTRRADLAGTSNT